jgi:hypothetical protein
LEETITYLGTLITLNIWLGVLGVLAMLGTQIWMARMLARMQDSLEAIRHGQEHIAELSAEVLRRQRP